MIYSIASEIVCRLLGEGSSDGAAGDSSVRACVRACVHMCRVGLCAGHKVHGERIPQQNHEGVIELVGRCINEFFLAPHLPCLRLPPWSDADKYSSAKNACGTRCEVLPLFVIFSALTDSTLTFVPSSHYLMVSFPI